MVKRVPLTIKIACFKQDECTKGKCVCTVGGIGKAIGDRLKCAGIDKADKLRRKTKCMSKSEFEEYLKCEGNANIRQARWAYKSLFGCVTETAVENKLAKTCAKCKQ